MVQVPGVGVGNLTIKAIPCADDGGSEDRFKKADSSSSEIVLYPNPTDALVTIKGLSETDQVMVCDVSGKVYQTQIGKPDLKLDVSLLLSGVYIVAIQQKNNIKHFKFIKNAKN